MPAALSSLSPLILSIVLFWVCTHLLHRLLAQRTRSLLPTTAALRITSNTLLAQTTVNLRTAHLVLRTTALNVSHARLSSSLSQKRNRRSREVLKRCYDVGSVLGVIGMAVGLGLVGWTAVQLAGVVAASGRGDVSVADAYEPKTVFAKRDALHADTGIRASADAQVPIHAIIPGLTTPFSHAPLLLLALLFAQLVHEAGHALAAALEPVPLLSAGLSLTLVFPSAFVLLAPFSSPSPPSGTSLSSEHMTPPPTARLRLTAAGAFHNLVLWLVLLPALGRTLWGMCGYREVGGWARVVVCVDEDSPLAPHLPPGALITYVDDTPLSSASSAGDAWSALLSAYPAQEDALGWCVPRAWFDEQPNSCCLPPSQSHADLQAQLACFVSQDDGSDTGRCLDPLPLLSALPNPKAPRRCASASACGSAHEFACVCPGKEERLVRLRVVMPVGEEGRERVVVWQGEKEEILEEVEVSTYLPRTRLLPLRLPLLVNAFFTYLLALSLSLYVFNLLPLSFLDGGQFLDALLDLFSSFSSVTSGFGDGDVELGSVGDHMQGTVVGEGRAEHGHGRWKRRVLRTAHWVSAGLVGVCALLGTVAALR
ncbi:uncharacterized protein LAESUDRAFT_812593 [Laetiporus sulphureus 93-53]|uniref:Endopeptidase S2P n=1 Tax=Laetiporus sulphureus 93-53 TaxID=1314785 RepID=A0A165EAK3_9APHY|nr:uncharacterized protein LAESUDRAFT_812593 [Laetiporus sulphureus 93-53]KZT06600.1 hypothetical protein LAESUDRAFT_812593 [Laetiporus sulphureus 93-53]